MHVRLRDDSRKPACNLSAGMSVWLEAAPKRRRTSRYLHSGTRALRQLVHSGMAYAKSRSVCLPLHRNLPQQICGRLGAGATGRVRHGRQPVGGEGAGDREAGQESFSTWLRAERLGGRRTTYLESVGTAEVDLEGLCLCTERRGRGRVGEGGTGMPVARETRAGRVGAFPSAALDDGGRECAACACACACASAAGEAVAANDELETGGDVESGELRWLCWSTGSRPSRVIIINPTCLAVWAAFNQKQAGAQNRKTLLRFYRAC